MIAEYDDDNGNGNEKWRDGRYRDYDMDGDGRQQQQQQQLQAEEDDRTIIREDDYLIYPWARDHLLPLLFAATATNNNIKQSIVITTPITETSSSSNKNDTAFLFWHIPKSGGTFVKAIYKCIFGKSVSVLPNKAQILLATSSSSSRRQKNNIDIAFSSMPDFAALHLFNPANKGRMMALFRHPVERLISKFYYLQVA